MSTEASEAKCAMTTAPPQGAPGWIEIKSHDPPKLKEFYGALFPSWKFKPATEQFKEEQIVMYEFAEPKGLSGGIVKAPEGTPRGGQPMGVGMTIYYYVESLEQTEKKVHELGGTTVMGKTAEGSHGWFMNFNDPDGNRFAAYEIDFQNMKKE